MTKDYQKMKRQNFLIKNQHKIDGKFQEGRCLDSDPDLVLKKSWNRIRFVLRGWIRIRSISDRIRNPA